MKKYYFIIQACIVLVMISLMGKNVIPNKIDVEHLEVVEIIGFDETENGIKITTLVKKNAENKQDTNSSGGESPSSEYKIESVEAKTYSQAADILRNMTDKQLLLSHVKYYLVGDNTAKSSLANVVDYLARTDDLSSTSKVFVCEKKSAEEFLNLVSTNDLNVAESISESISDSYMKNFTQDITVLELLNSFLQEDIVGTIPFISLSGDDQEKENAPKQVFLNVLGVIKDMKVVDQIYKNEVEDYKLAIGKVEDMVLLIDIDKASKGSIVLNCTRKKYNMEFDVQDGRLLNINILTKFEANIDEADINTPIFNFEAFSKMQGICEQQVKERITSAILKEKQLGIDYMNIESVFERQHPYIYRKIKEDFFEQLCSANVIVDVGININNTYDVLQSNKYQKGGT